MKVSLSVCGVFEQKDHVDKTDAIVIRLADFSESSRVVTFFSRDFGRISALAKGAKRLKGPFDAALDLLSNCRVVFLRKSSGALSLLTQAQLAKKFVPVPGDLNSLYGAYYVADLLSCLTEEEDADPLVFDLAVNSLDELSNSECDPLSAVVRFELQMLKLVGLFPNLHNCTACGNAISNPGRYAHWVAQGGLLCGECRKQEYEHRSVSGGTIAVLRRLTEDTESQLAAKLKLSKKQALECHKLAVSAITHVVGRRPNTLRYLNFK